MGEGNVLDVETLIHIIRGQKVILDADLARLYGVPTKVFNQAVKRNLDKFPEDFMFRLTGSELEILRSQIATASGGYEEGSMRSQIVTGYDKHGNKVLRSQIVTSRGHGGTRYLPYAFTEHGAIMAANVLNSPQATQMSVFVVRAFIRMRSALAAHQDVAAAIESLRAELTARLDTHETAIVDILERIMKLIDPPPVLPDPPKPKIGF